MANNLRESENTDLIDVSDIESTFEGAPAAEEEMEDASDSISTLARPENLKGPVIAGFKDRFAALVIDLSFLYIIYWVLMVIYRSIAIGEAAGPIPVAGINGIIFHSLVLFIALIWFAIPEIVFDASIGKLFCRLIVRGMDGDYASILSIFIRNILLPLDIILSPLLIGASMMEWASLKRRLGDILSGTLVFKKLGNPPRQYALTLDMLASASGRAWAFLFDFILLAALLFGMALMLSSENVLASMLVVVACPIAFLLFFILPEYFTKTSPGKWLFGYAICLENGAGLDLASSIVRTVWRVYDCNPFGFYGALLSLRRQRPGDTAAQTVVVSAPREWRGFIGLMAMIVVVAATIYAGLANRDSFLKGTLDINFLPSVDLKGIRASGTKTPANLLTKNFTFAAGDASSIRSPSIYQAGETLFIVFDVDGYKRAGSRVSLEEDLSIRYPDDSLGLKLDNINVFDQELKDAGPVRFENKIEIPANATPGRYTVTVTVRDRIARQELKEQRFFYVTMPGTSPVPPMPGAEPPIQVPAAPLAPPGGTAAPNQPILQNNLQQPAYGQPGTDVAPPIPPTTPDPQKAFQ